jgi:hypothetical protein
VAAAATAAASDGRKARSKNGERGRRNCLTKKVKEEKEEEEEEKIYSCISPCNTICMMHASISFSLSLVNGGQLRDIRDYSTTLNAIWRRHVELLKAQIRSHPQAGVY